MPAAEHSSHDLSVEEIEAKMAQIGFEEIRRHWADFKWSGLSLSAVDEALLFSGILIWQSSPQVLLGLAVFVGVGLAVHFWYQFKSVRAVK